MLKSKISKAGFWSHGLLLLVTPAVHIKPDHRPSLKGHLKMNLFPQRRLSRDTAILFGNDSLNAIRSFVPDSMLSLMPAIQLNPAAVRFVKTYMKKNNEELQMVKKRSEPCFKIIESVFRQQGLPVELKYLAVIESDLDAQARSRVGAKGPWQLMATTARELGLKVTRKYDERTYYYKSTVAAARYLKSLYSEYGDWLLVIAAYNSGTGTIEHAIKRSGTRNFWKLQNFLPAETRAHVKRFIGTHYFFEDKGSITTLTKSEVIQHLKDINQYMEKMNMESGDTKMNIYTGPDNYHSATNKSIAGLSMPVIKSVD